MGLVCWQVFARFVLRDPSSVTEEAARFTMIWVGLLGAARAAGRRMHLAIDVLGRRLPGLRGALDILVRGVCATFAVGVLGVGGWSLVDLTLDLGQLSPALGWQLGHVYLVLPLAGLLMAFLIFGPSPSEED
ncbi:MAG: TRAP transporter small permease [Thermoanaerobaculia bacterium]|nr:TRAP transporter small permease [Thermoanaerobaculia bacterium]